MSEDVKAYKVQYVYHTVETAETTIWATSPENAQQIARFAFAKKYTARCVLDHVEVQP